MYVGKRNFIITIEFTAMPVQLVWQNWLWSFQTGGTKLEKILPKNQHTKGKFLILRIGLAGSLSSLQ